jgi:hypothetical protein
MATNFQERFDAAIKRSGRFDLLLCMGPPKLNEKLDRLHVAYFPSPENEQTIKAGGKIREYLMDRPELQEQLELYTFGEFRSFLKTIGDENSIGNGIEKLGKAKFQERLEDNSKYVTLKLRELEPLLKAFNRKRLAEVMEEPFTLEELEGKGIKVSSPIVRFLCDRKESKEQ